MALDKLVDSAQLDSDLGDVADAIRAKSGGSSPLAFPAGFVSEIGSIPTGGGGVIDSGFVSFHTGTNSKDLMIPFTSELWASSFIVEILPFKTWALVNDVWVERDSLDFTGITGFKGGQWHPLPVYIVITKHESPIDSNPYPRYLNQAQYSNGTNGNFNSNLVNFDSENSCLTFTNLDGYVCVTDGGLTFKYTIRRWSDE